MCVYGCVYMDVCISAISDSIVYVTIRRTHICMAVSTSPPPHH